MKKPYLLKIERDPAQLQMYIGHQSFTIQVSLDPDVRRARALNWYKAQLTTALDRLCAEAAAASKAREEGYLNVLRSIANAPPMSSGYSLRDEARIGINRVDGTAAKAVDEIVRTLEGMDDEDRYVRNFWIYFSIGAALAVAALWAAT